MPVPVTYSAKILKTSKKRFTPDDAMHRVVKNIGLNGRRD